MGILDDILAGIEEPEDTKKKQQDPAEQNTDPKEPETTESNGTPWYSDEFRKAYKINDQVKA
jgi:hypothetical protein